MRLPGRTWRRVTGAVVVLAGVAAVSPPGRAWIKGLALVPDVVPAPWHPLDAFTPTPHRSPVTLRDGVADLYRPRGWASAPGVVLVPGGDVGGKDDPRIVGLAEAIARAGRQVLVPQLGLAAQRLDVADPGRIRDAVTWLAQRTSRKVVVAGISYGGALTLVAIEQQPAIQRDIALVATLGTYYNLVDVLEGVTTHQVPFDGHLVAWTPDPSALGIAEAQLAALLSPGDGAALTAAWNARNPGGLGAAPLAVYDLLENRDPLAFEPLEEALPGGVQGVLADFSPARSITEVDVPLYALHARSDPAAPPAESRLLVNALSSRVRTRLIVVGNFSHLSPTVSLIRDIRDGWRVAGFASAVIRAQEGWPRL